MIGVIIVIVMGFVVCWCILCRMVGIVRMLLFVVSVNGMIMIVMVGVMIVIVIMVMDMVGVMVVVMIVIDWWL